MALDIAALANKFSQKGGTRPSLFRVSIGGINAEDTELLAQSTSLPPAELGIISLDWRGRQLKIPGDRTFADWTATFYNDDEMNIYKALVEWNNEINDFVSNEATFGKIYRPVEVAQLDRGGSPITKYTLNSCFCSQVGEVSLDATSRDTISTFTATFAYTDYKYKV